MAVRMWVSVARLRSFEISVSSIKSIFTLSRFFMETEGSCLNLQKFVITSYSSQLSLIYSYVPAAF